MPGNHADSLQCSKTAPKICFLQLNNGALLCFLLHALSGCPAFTNGPSRLFLMLSDHVRKATRVK